MTSGGRWTIQVSAKDLLIWFFILVSTVYILYSSNLLLTKHEIDCLTAHKNRTNKQNVQITDSSNVKTNSIQPNKSVLVNNTNDTSSSNSSTNGTNPRSVVEQNIEENVIPTWGLIDRGTKVNHVMFGIAASSHLWENRKEYIKSWWDPKKMRGIVWVDDIVRVGKHENLPPTRVSTKTTKFKYSNVQGSRSALRISRIVSETVRLGLKDVRWFVMGDDDTIFMVENLLSVLNKYDHNQHYYLGSSSESHVQNIFFSYAMAYGGGGFAISYPLAVELSKMQDRCIQRYPGLYGSDDRIQACMSELGVPIQKENGFHQCDLYGDLYGILAAHPVAPLLSIHHLDLLEPIFPQMTRVEAVRHFLEPVKLDPSSIIQQSFCYDGLKSWTIAVSWGYAVQIYREIVSPRELERPTRTFLNWYPRADYTAYSFNTRPVPKNPCQKPFVYFMKMVKYHEASNLTVGFYTRRDIKHPFCRWRSESPEKIQTVVVFKKPDPRRWFRAPRRDCCRILPSKNGTMLYIWVDNCRVDEVTELRTDDDEEDDETESGHASV